MQHLANDGRAYMKIITHTGTGTNYLYAHLGAVTAIVFETFTTVVPKAMVITDDECLHPITVSQKIRHKLAGSQARYFLRKVKHETIVHPCFLEQCPLFFRSSQQFRTIIRFHHLTGMNRKGN